MTPPASKPPPLSHTAHRQTSAPLPAGLTVLMDSKQRTGLAIGAAAIGAGAVFGVS